MTVMQRRSAQRGGKSAGLLQSEVARLIDVRRTSWRKGPGYVPKSDGMVLPNEVYRNRSRWSSIRSEHTPFAASAQHDTIEVIVKTEDGRVIQQKLLTRKRELGGAVLGLA